MAASSSSPPPPPPPPHPPPLKHHPPLPKYHSPRPHLRDRSPPPPILRPSHHHHPPPPPPPPPPKHHYPPSRYYSPPPPNHYSPYPLRDRSPPAPLLRPPNYPPPPSPPPPPPPHPYPHPYHRSSNHQVLISFEGNDVGNGFLSFVEEAFTNKNVNVYCNTERRYNYLNPLFFKRVEEAIVAVVIFSDIYAASEWCLNELFKINKQMTEGKLHVIPIFYKVDVENVKTLAGNFGFNFKETMRNYGGDAGYWIFDKWEKALKSISQKFGLSSSDYRCENDFVNAIVEEVEKVLYKAKEEADAAEANPGSK